MYMHCIVKRFSGDSLTNSPTRSYWLAKKVYYSSNGWV